MICLKTVIGAKKLSKWNAMLVVSVHIELFRQIISCDLLDHICGMASVDRNDWFVACSAGRLMHQHFVTD